MKYFACRFGADWKLQKGQSAPEAFKQAFAHELICDDNYVNEAIVLEGDQRGNIMDEFFRLQLARLVKTTTRRFRRSATPTTPTKFLAQTLRMEVPDEIC